MISKFDKCNFSKLRYYAMRVNGVCSLTLIKISSMYTDDTSMQSIEEGSVTRTLVLRDNLAPCVPYIASNKQWQKQLQRRVTRVHCRYFVGIEKWKIVPRSLSLAVQNPFALCSSTLRASPGPEKRKRVSERERLFWKIYSHGPTTFSVF